MEHISKYLDIAYIELQTVRSLTDLWDKDDSCLRVGCRCLAEGIECCLRYVAVVSDMSVSRGHNLRRLLDAVSEKLDEYTWFPRLKKLVRHMCTWHDCTINLESSTCEIEYAMQVRIVLEQMVLDLRNFKSSSYCNALIKERVQRILENNKTVLSSNDILMLLPAVYCTDLNIPVDNLYNAVMLAVRIKERCNRVV